jgi:voltage-gated potassium channel
MERDIGRLDGHYIICGMGRVGRSVARELARKPAPFVVIENAETKLQRYSGEEWLVVTGDATQEQTLRKAQIERARGLIAATTTDATNLYIVLTARGLNPHLKIIARASEDGAEKHLLTAGADAVVSPYSFAGAAHRAIAAAAACGQLSRYRDHAPGHRSGDWRDPGCGEFRVCGKNH